MQICFLSIVLASPPGQQLCKDPQIYTDGASQPCLNRLCTTYKSDNGMLCANPQVIRVIPVPGCICKENYAQIRDNVCFKIGSCECPAVASLSDSNVYQTQGIPIPE